MFALVAIAALFSFSMATPYYAAGYCADVHDQCTTTSWINDCSYNPSVRRQCPQTCGLCTYSGYFGLGAYPGYAAPVAYASPAYVASAYVAPAYVAPAYAAPAYAAPAYVAPALAVVCKDIIEGCEELKSAGWCSFEYKHQKGLISLQCKRTCGFCSKK